MSGHLSNPSIARLRKVWLRSTNEHRTSEKVLLIGSRMLYFRAFLRLAPRDPPLLMLIALQPQATAIDFAGLQAGGCGMAESSSRV